MIENKSGLKVTKNWTGKAPEKRPKVPRYLKESRAFFKRITAGWELDAAGLAILEMACLQMDRAADARRILAKEGSFVNGRYGAKLHPALTAERRATASAAALLRQLDLDDDEPAKTLGRPPEGWMHGVETR